MKAPRFDYELAAAHRRSWEAATPEEQEKMLKPEREAYKAERAQRAVIAVYIGGIRDYVRLERGGAVSPASIVANGAVVRIASLLGAVAYATDTGVPRLAVDNNAVTYYAEERMSPDNLVLHEDPVIDPLLEDLADALGCRWEWIGDEAIELVEREA